MKQQNSVGPENDARILKTIERLAGDPLKFVMYAFPWGEEGTPLENHSGPDDWQRKVLEMIRDKYRTDGTSFRIQVVSGHGIGKGALTAWLNLWFISTHPNPQMFITANTAKQLETKTWREIQKWHNMMIHKHWFTCTSTTLFKTGHKDLWELNAIPWSEENSDAFQGAHDRFLFYTFDEASNIADSIFDATEGAMTTPGAIWLILGNPTRNTGRFRDIFYKDPRWKKITVDSRVAKMVNRKEIDRMIDYYGKDSDFTRVRIYGEFPKQAPQQLISREIAEEFLQREMRKQDYDRAPVVIGIDVAWSGEDSSVIAIRQGLRLLELRIYPTQDTFEVAQYAMRAIKEFKCHYVYIDTIGWGSGVYDNLKHAGYKKIIHSAMSTMKASNPIIYQNKRIEMAIRVRDWLRGASCAEDVVEKELLVEEMCAFLYEFNKQSGRMQLEANDDVKANIGRSPDRYSALALTFFDEISYDVFEEEKYYQPHRKEPATGRCAITGQ